MRLGRRIGLAALAAVTVGLAGAHWWPAGPGAKEPGTDKRPARVNAVVAHLADTPVVLKAHGHVVPLNQVDVRSQLPGTVRGVHFREGEEVKAGQLLFTIDASDLAAQLDRARASAAQIEAQVDDAERELARTRQLAQSHFYSASAVDAIASKLESLQAQYKAAQAEVARMRVLVGRANITAPTSGLSGAVAVHPGSLAEVPASQPLVTIVQVDPIGVEFELPESQLGRLIAARDSGEVKVTLTIPEGGARLSGTLAFLNNTVNRDTGSISLKAKFANPGRALWPGAYVELSVEAGATSKSVSLPPQAVLEGPDGRFVYVVDGQGRTLVRPVRLLRMQDQKAVVDGLQEGEKIVTEGQAGLQPGTAVAVTLSKPG